MRIVEALESKGCRVPVMKGEAELAEKLTLITRQVGIPNLVLCPDCQYSVEHVNSFEKQVP